MDHADDHLMILFQHGETSYEKIRCLGTGSFGQVYLCRKQEPDCCRYVALKTIDVASLRRSAIDSAMNEIKVLSFINQNANIVQYYGSFFWKNKFYIEMEYADAGTLAEFLSRLPKPLTEFEILALFNQIAAAVVYLHRNQVIHRDIKTKNIFLNKQGFIKLGDFGISKILDANAADVRSFVGTPLYTSPEIFEGKKYNKPCDIWSLGCVLYEMATLTKAFDESAFPILRRKIIQGKYRSLNESYSKMFRHLVQSMLQKQPSRRPTAWNVLRKVTQMLDKMSTSSVVNLANNHLLTTLTTKPNDSDHPPYESSSVRHRHHHHQQHHSYLYRMELHQREIALIPIHFSGGIHIKQVVKGARHYVALTHDHRAFSWGDGSHGELGHGPETKRCEKPTLITSSIGHWQPIKVAAGNGFTIFLDKNGLLRSCGHGPCIGSGGEQRWQPTIINRLLNINVVDVDSGPEHVVAISYTGHVYGWGTNANGTLGLGSSITGSPVMQPTRIEDLQAVVARVICGPEATALVDATGGHIWMCGHNRYNRLALDQPSPSLSGLLCDRRRQHRNQPVPVAWRPQRVRGIKPGRRIKQISLGQNYSVFVFTDGTVMATGCNEQAQLGLNHNRPVWKPEKVVHISGIKSIHTGSSFTLALKDDSLHFWGTRRISPNLSNSNKNNENPEQQEFIIGQCDESLMNIVQYHGPDYPILKIIQPRTIVKKFKHLRMMTKNFSDSVILFPQCILKLYSTRTFWQEKQISLVDLFSFPTTNDDEIFILINSVTFDHHHQDDNIMVPDRKSNLELIKASETTTKHVRSRKR